jgi:hypothetical protein
VTATPDDLLREAWEAWWAQDGSGDDDAHMRAVITAVRARDADRLAAVTAERDAWEQTAMDASRRFARCTADRDAALARLAAVEAKHRNDGWGFCTACVTNSPLVGSHSPWPCPTYRAAFPDQPTEGQQ